jgi:hypothetical protein
VVGRRRCSVAVYIRSFADVHRATSHAVIQPARLLPSAA